MAEPIYYNHVGDNKRIYELGKIECGKQQYRCSLDVQNMKNEQWYWCSVEFNKGKWIPLIPPKIDTHDKFVNLLERLYCK